MSDLTPEFLAWANQTNLRRAVTIEATITRVSDDEPLTLYLTTGAPRRGTWDGAHNWERCVLSPPQLQASAQELSAGASLHAFGTLELALDERAKLGPDGDLTWAILTRDYRWAGGPVVVRVGGPDLAWAYWGVALRGYLGRVSLERGKASVPLVATSAALATVNIPPDTYGDSDGVPAATLGQVKPCCIGPVNNLTPVLVSDGAGSGPWVYQMHAYGPINAISEVRVADAAVSPSSTDLTNGKFTLASKPTGTVTCDAQGWKPSGVYLTTAAQIIEHLLRTWAPGVGDDQIDTAAFAAAATAAPQVLAAYWTSTITIQQALDGLVLGLPLWWGDDAQGRYTLMPFGAPSGTPVLDIYDGTSPLMPPEGAAKAWGLKLAPNSKWYSKVKVKGDRNYTVNTNPAASLSEDRKTWLKEDYRSREATGSAPAGNPLVDEGEMATAMSDLDDCQDAADREIALHGVERDVLTCECLHAALALKKGDVARVFSDLKGMDSGRLFVVTGKTLDLPHRAGLTLWG